MAILLRRLLKVLTKVCTDLHKVYIDDEAYDLSHGQAYEFYGVDRDHGAMVIVRPDQRIFRDYSYFANADK
jgi:hypothetical protein